MPLALIEKFAELCAAMNLAGTMEAPPRRASQCETTSDEASLPELPLTESAASGSSPAGARFQTHFALGIDIRSGREIEKLPVVLEALTDRKISYEILFLEARDETLLKRYKETRRSHPLARDGRIDEGILRERQALAFLKGQANYILDTSNLLTRELRAALDKIFVDQLEYSNIYITILSFGFKYGIPADSDLMFDVRFLPNPYYVDDLRHKTGLEQEVQDYVMNSEKAHEFLDRLTDMIEFLLPNYVLEGKNQLVISIGCTGGKHRSVTIAEQLYRHLSGHTEYGLKLEHRDIRI
ncbi:MAG: RNase adapter RapZ [Lachnospiraceae bacterium]|nr:RNase adapter RapZ [Lachnospiraceae bacterium]